MMILSESLPFFVTILSTIIISSRCESVSSFVESRINRYQKFVANVEEDSDSNGKWPMIENEQKCSRVLAKSVDKIMEVYMPSKKMLCIFTAHKAANNCFAHALEDLLKLGTRSVITMIQGGRNIELESVVFQKPNVYILLGIELSAVLQSLIDFGEMGSTWNPRGLYISTAQSKEEAASFMTRLWKQFVYKVIVLVFSSNTSHAVEAYTWRPYHLPNNCGPPTTENIIKLGKFTNEFDKFEKESDTEPGTVPDNFGNCPLNVSFNIWQPFVYNTTDKDENAGIEVNLIKMVCERIGITVNAHYHKLTLVRDESEAWAGSIIPKAKFLKDYDLSNPYIQDGLGWVVPNSNEIRSIGGGISSTIWALSSLAVILIAVSLRVAGSQHWFLWVWGSLLEQFDNKVPMKIRGIWGCWLLLCLHMSVAYRTELVSNLAKPSIATGPQSQSELVETGLKLGFLASAEAYFSYTDKIEKRILERYIPCETIEECYKEIPTGRGVFIDKMHADYLDLQKGETSVIADQVRRLPVSLVYKVVMVFKKGHPALAGFDKVCQHALQTGLVRKLIKNVENKQANIHMRRINSRKDRALSFAQVREGFYLLAAGLTIAGLTFLCETFHEVFEIGFSSCITKTRSLWSEKPGMLI